MADNTRVLNPSAVTVRAPGDIIATDDIAGVKYQRIKLIHGDDGVNDGDVSTGNPLPVEVVSATSSVSVVNSTTTPLNNGATWTGTAEDVSRYASVVVACKTDKAGKLYLEFSPDGTNWDSSIEMTVDAATNEVHRFSVTRQYFRTKFVNDSGQNQTYLRLQVMYGNQPQLSSRLNSSIQTDSDSIIARAVLTGETDGGQFRRVPITNEGHLEVAVHGPRNPFGSIHVESLTPVFQSDAVYGINLQQERVTTNSSGTATASDSMFVCTTGTTVGGFGTIQSRKRLRYRPGQGAVGRFAGYFTTGVADSIQVMGFGHADDGFYFGYNGTSFGILYSRRGIREIRTLTVTTASTATNNYVVTLNGVAYNVTATNNGSTLKTAYEIASGTYAGWEAEPIGSTVIFTRNSAGPASGTYSLAQTGAATPAAGTFAQDRVGTAATETWIPKSEWNGDTLDGTGPSGQTLDPTKGNVYQIGIQYLGFGAIVFQIEVAPSDRNNPEFLTVHTIKLPNTLTTTSLSNPAFPFTMAAYSAGSSTDIAVRCGSFAGFIEGPKVLHGPRFSYFNTLTTVGAANFQALFTIRNSHYFGGRANQSVINLLSVAGSIKHTQPAIFYLIKNGTLAGTPNFSRYGTGSCSLWDTSATTVTFADNSQIVWTGHLGETGEIDHHFNNDTGQGEVTIQPGEWFTLACRASTGTPSYVTGGINTREDQ